MKEIEIFDPAMCCSTGVCGPSVDKDLLRIATLIDALKNMGIEVKRHNLSSDPQAFIHNEKVKRLLQEKGADVLPVTLVDREIAVTGEYPTTAQMSEWTGKDLAFVLVRNGSCCCEESSEPKESGCCCGDKSKEQHEGCCCGKITKAMRKYSVEVAKQQKYLFFTGKGGVGKTSLACATAVALADSGEKVLLVSTDPASNLQDVFRQDISQHGTTIADVPGLTVVNLDPLKAADEYRESVVGPYRGILPDSAIANMEEQLSGSCTVEIAAFNQFADFLTNEADARKYDHIIFDTAPTGHTLRMLQLPTAWTSFIRTSKHVASCLGQLSGLESRKEVYRQAVDNLADGTKTRLILVSRPQETALKEAARSARELAQLGIDNQLLVLNGIMDSSESDDSLAKAMFSTQQQALKTMPETLATMETLYVPLRSYNMDTVDNIRKMLVSDHAAIAQSAGTTTGYKKLDDLIRALHDEGKRVVFTMGKGGVGKTTIATRIALGLKALGDDVLLTTTDPANHLNTQMADHYGIETAVIDEKKVLEAYKDEVRAKAREAGVTDFSYIEEDLRSPCTQEIAVFRRFAEIVMQADDKTVVIDTAPTGHALLLLDSTQSYDRQIAHSEGDAPEAVQRLLPRLRDDILSDFVIVTLPEPTPVLESKRLRDDLERAGIHQQWWVINQCLILNHSTDSFLRAKANSEVKWIEEVRRIADSHLVLRPWIKYQRSFASESQR